MPRQQIENAINRPNSDARSRIMETEENVATSVKDEREDLKTMSNEKTRSRCNALTKQGEQCKNHPSAGSQYCRVHQAAERPAQQADIEPMPLEVEGKVAKGQQQHPKKHKWDTRACFKVFFEVGTAEHNIGKWQTRVYFEESSRGVDEETKEIAGVQTTPWVNWILERANSRRVPVEPVPLKTEITAEPIPAEAEVVTPPAPVTPYDAQIKIVDVQVSEARPSAGARERRLTAEVRFRVSGTEAESMAKDQVPFWIQFHTVDLESGAAKLVSSEQSQLQPAKFEYTRGQAFPIPDRGRYELQCIIFLLPPGEAIALHRGPTVRVIPWNHDSRIV
jgi:hypothetical protein